MSTVQLVYKLQGRTAVRLGFDHMYAEQELSICTTEFDILVVLNIPEARVMQMIMASHMHLISPGLSV